MKKIITFIIAATLILGLTACVPIGLSAANSEK
jgi:hypothetical protein